MIDAKREPRLELCARHDLIWCLITAGYPREALQRLEDCRMLYLRFPDAWTRLRLGWVEGRIARALGDLTVAEGTFRTIRHEFEERAMYYEHSLVSIDLAETCVTSGRTH